MTRYVRLHTDIFFADIRELRELSLSRLIKHKEERDAFKRLICGAIIFITDYPNRVSKVAICRDAITNADELRFQRDCTIWQR